MFGYLSLSSLAIIALIAFFFRKPLHKAADSAELVIDSATKIIDVTSHHASDYISVACAANTAELLETQLKLAKTFNIDPKGDPTQFYFRLREEAFNNLGKSTNSTNP